MLRVSWPEIVALENDVPELETVGWYFPHSLLHDARIKCRFGVFQPYIQRLLNKNLVQEQVTRKFHIALFAKTQ